MAFVVPAMSVIALGTAWWLSKRKRKGSKPNGDGPTPAHRDPWSTPLLWDGPTLEAQATAEICRLGPLIAEDRLAGAVWANLFPAIAWPVLPTDHETVRTAGQLVTELVNEYIGTPTFCLIPDPAPVGPTPVRPVPIIPTVPDTPTPIDVDQLEDPYPTPGKFYKVQLGDMFNGEDSNHSIIYRALLSAAFLAAKNLGGYDDAAAGQYARTVARNGAARAIYRDMVQCSPFNDSLYGTYGYGPKASPGPHMRAIRLMPYHADNRARLRAGQHAIRMIALKEQSDRGKGNATGSGNELEYLWLPALNLQRLWDGGSWDDRITSAGLTWEDGSSQYNPPPEVRIATELLPKTKSGANFPFGCR